MEHSRETRRLTPLKRTLATITFAAIVAAGCGASNDAGSANDSGDLAVQETASFAVLGDLVTYEISGDTLTVATSEGASIIAER